MSLQGTLKTLGITEVLEFMSDRAASGRLDVTTEMGTASYGFVEGAVVEAEYSFIRESGVDAAEATYYVVSELDGTFYFDDDRLPAVQGESTGESVGSVLARTVDIAEKWTDVEAVIPSPNHLLTRNSELDGSVTIQPEWWKALQMIGDGSTSLQLASALELSALDASLTALAMTNAGLLIVREIDPLDIELEVSEHADLHVEDAPAEHPDVESHAETDAPAVDRAEPVTADTMPVDTMPRETMSDDVVPDEVHERADHVGFSFYEAEPAGADEFEPSIEVSAPDPDSSHESPFQPVDMLEMVDVEPPTPHFDEPDPEPVAATTMSFAAPVVEEVAPVVPESIDEFAGSSGMDDLSELEYVLEPDGHVGAVLSGAAPVVEEDDDGWSNGHDSFSEPLQAMTANSPAVQPPPVESPDDGQPPSPFDVIDVPAAPSAFATPSVPVPDVPPAMEVVDLPAPPPPAASTIEHPTAPVPESSFSMGTPVTPEVHSSATEMAGEVLDDLASMTDELESRAAGTENWELDGTFVPDDNPPPPSVEGDPFGDLGDLLNDTSGDERGSVLKFLRRD